jgi:phospholipid-binding lipoprotein MlaA
MSFCKHLPSLLALLLLPAFASAQHTPPAPGDDYEDYPILAVSDPLEGVNRAVFAFNDGFYKIVARPVAKGYTAVLPEPARDGISNVLSNLLFPVRFAGSLLQGKLDRVARETGKFVVNSTVGVAGIMNVSDRIPALKDVPEEDVGQAFASWGIGHGPYLVLPFMGPSSTRDFVGSFGDRYATPWNWEWLPWYEWEWATGLQVTNIVSGLPGGLKIYDSTVRAAADPYVAVRTGYIQFRNFEAAR